MLYATLKTLHVLAIVIWVGGMAFAHFFLRPALTHLEPSVRLSISHAVLQRFLRTITYVSVLALVSGFWLMGHVAKRTVQTTGEFHAPLDWNIMALLGTLMVLIFGHIRFALFGRLHRAVLAQDWGSAATAMQRLRAWVLVNLCLGLGIITTALLL